MVIGIGFVGMVTGTIATFFVSKAEELTKRNRNIDEIKETLDCFKQLDIEEVKEISQKLLDLKKQEK
jgi:voltage-gated potassium channel